MANMQDRFAKCKPINVGIDVHKRAWVMTVLGQGEELYHATVVAEAEGLIQRLRRFEASEVHTVYEAGPTGYWLHDALVEAGFDSMVTLRSLVPRREEYLMSQHRGLVSFVNVYIDISNVRTPSPLRK
jgi:hypothetical protein